MIANLSTSQPPPFLKLLSHTLRWRLLLALAQSDLRVMELIERVAQPQNLVSYHLQRLRKEKLVEVHRSGADSREIYYSINLDEIHRLYVAAGELLHPALGEAKEDDTSLVSLPTIRVLFLCTHNSARSQMAEGIMRTLGRGKMEVVSAGTEPAQVHPFAIRAMDELKIDIRAHRSKSLEEFLGQTFDYIITVCDRAREACPVFPGDPIQIHWSFPDPSAVEGSEAVRFEAFRTMAVQLNTRINYLLMMMRREED